MPDCIDYMECIYGICLAGAKPVPINLRYRATELSYVINDADIKLLISSAVARDYLDIRSMLMLTYPELESSTSTRKLTVAKAPQLNSIVMLCDQGSGAFIGSDEFYRQGSQIEDEQVHRQRSVMCLLLRAGVGVQTTR